MGEQLGQHPVHDHRAERHVELLARSAATSSIVSLTGISSGVGDDVERGERGIGEQLDHPVGLVADRPDVHELLDRVGGVELGDHVTGRGGVDDDEVPVGAALERLAHLPADLADGEDLLHARRGVGDEVEHARERAEPPEHRHAQVAA